MCILPVFIGVVLSIFFGIVSSKFKGRWIDKLIQLFCVFAISAPVFFLGLMLVFSLCYVMGLCTAFGNLEIPYYLLFLVIPGLIIWQTHPYIAERTRKKSIISNTFITGINFGFVLMVYTLLDITFGLNGFGDHLVTSIQLYDYAGVLFALIIIFFIVILSSNLLFSGSRYIQSKYLKRNFAFEDEVIIEKEGDEISISTKVKTYLLDRLKSPYFYIGAILVSIIIAIAMNPNLITQYTLEETLGFYPGAWDPPSPGHPLGQGWAGRDVLALIMWGIQDLILFGFFAVLIGLTGGIIIGVISGYIVVKFQRWGFKAVIGSMIIFYIFPIFVYGMLSRAIFDPLGLSQLVLLLTIGILLIPSFARGFLNGVSMKSNIRTGIRSLINHIPSNFAISAMIYVTLGFLGFVGVSYQLGSIINQGRPHLTDAPWGIAVGGLVIFIIIFSFFVFHIGLRDYKSKPRK